MNLSSFHSPLNPEPSDAEIDRKDAYLKNIARERHIDRQMRYGPCSHLWSKPDDHGVVECQWCFCRILKNYLTK